VTRGDGVERPKFSVTYFMYSPYVVCFRFIVVIYLLLVQLPLIAHEQSFTMLYEWCGPSGPN